ncbi:hypothetical protein E4T52_06837 [Aureobasidium sp. EXF-3400]|nr:hypothetical protein E4T51_05981 [Aureobasidium sp. EXF-12344]KAI4778267.1 hypothetical protein E4T52_06837 [Aureobasidium sp. EXF-3400]
MKGDCLARRAILFVTFIITATILYGVTTRFLFTAPNYDDVSIDPEGGSYYDYGSKIAAAVWKGAGHWIGMAEPSPTNVTVILAATSDDAMEKWQEQELSTESDEPDSDPTLAAQSKQENIFIDGGHQHTTNAVTRPNLFPNNTTIASVLQDRTAPEHHIIM